MKHLVTGGAGFIGSHLTESLLADGHEVVVLDDFSTGREENLAALADCPWIEVVRGSITDAQVVRSCVAAVERVFHLAAAVGVRLIVDQPVKTIETNVYGTGCVLDACAEYGKPVLLTSTSEVYGKSDRVPFREDDDSVIGPPAFRRWGYASSKALDEFLAMAHWHQSGLPVVIARLFNTIGPRQVGRYGMVVPRFARQALAGEPITVYGHGTQTRCFCHVSDVVGALRRLIDSPDCYGQVVNVGSDHEIAINELAERVRSLAGSTSEIQQIPYEQAYGTPIEDMLRRVPDLGKLRRLVGYDPRYALEDTLRDVIEDVRSRMNND